MELKDLTITRYELFNNKRYTDRVELVLLSGLYSGLWVIKQSDSYLFKSPDHTGCFYFEFVPGDYDSFVSDYTFKSAEEALGFWLTNRQNIVVTLENKRQQQEIYHDLPF